MRFSRVVSFLILFLGLDVISTLGQQVAATWTDTSGNWSNPANWSTLTVPNNGGGTTYSVIIDTPNAFVLNSGRTIDNLRIGTTDKLTVISLNLVSGASSNSGEIELFGTFGAGLSINSGAYFTNSGPFSGVGLGTFLTNSGTFINNSTMFLTEFTLSNDAGAYFANFGTISQDSERLTNGGTFNNAGVITLFTGIDPIEIINTGTFNNSGMMNVSFTVLSGNFSNNGTLNNSGTMTVDSDLQGGISTISNSGTINNTGTLNITTSVGAGFSNSGTINNTGALNIAQSPTNMGGSFGNSGTLSNWGTISNSGVFTNSGAVLINRTGLFTTSTNYTQTAGSPFVNGTLTATSGAIVDIHGGVLGGTGTINGNVLMAGTMMPGDAPSTLTIFGNYEQASTGFFHELMSPFSQAFLDVSGNVVLDPGALLEISLLGGFNPLGSTISIMDFSTLSGQFANGSSFWDDGFLWDITYRQHEIDVTAVQAPEPSSLLLLALGSLTIGTFVKRKK